MQSPEAVVNSILREQHDALRLLLLGWHDLRGKLENPRDVILAIPKEPRILVCKMEDDKTELEIVEGEVKFADTEVIFEQGDAFLHCGCECLSKHRYMQLSRQQLTEHKDYLSVKQGKRSIVVIAAVCDSATMQPIDATYHMTLLRYDADPSQAEEAALRSRDLKSECDLLAAFRRSLPKKKGPADE